MYCLKYFFESIIPEKNVFINWEFELCFTQFIWNAEEYILLCNKLFNTICTIVNHDPRKESNFSSYCIVEFPKEKSSGQTPMAIISSLWIVEEDEKLFCYWPNYMKDNKAMTLAIINHDELELDQCLKCEIVIKYSNCK